MIKQVCSECSNGHIKITFEADYSNIDDVNDIIRLSDYVRHMHDEPEEMQEDKCNDNEYDEVNHPDHYVNSGIECIDEMILLYGKEETMSFCKLNSHKYRKRAFDKGGRKDIDKSNWYIRKYMELKRMNEYEIIDKIKRRYS